MKAPACEEDAHSPWLEGQDMDEIFCWQYTRVVQNDGMVRFENEHYQIEASKKIRVYPRQKITVKRSLKGEMTLWADRAPLKYRQIEAPKAEMKEKRGEVSSQRRLSGQAGKRNSPWSRWNPLWLKGDKTGMEAT